MRRISNDVANTYLTPLGFQVAEWERMQPLTGSSPKWVRHVPSSDAHAHRCVSDRILDWLPPASWRLLRISLSHFSLESVIVLNRMAGADFVTDMGRAQDCLLFEYTGDRRSDYEQNVLLSFFLNLLLLETNFCQVASAGGVREILDIADTYVYFSSDSDERLSSARELISEMKSSPLKMANWIMNAEGVHP